MNLEGYLTLLVKLAAMAAIASVVARSNKFQSMLMRETRSLSQRALLSLWLGVVFAASVAVRVAGRQQPAYQAADLGLEGSLLAGLLGGYVTGLLSGILISLPAFLNHEYLTLPLLASIGVLGGLLRDMAPTPEEVWRFSPYPDLNIYRFFKEKRDHWRTGFQLIFFAAILCAEALRQGLGDLFSRNGNGGDLVFYLKSPPGSEPGHSLAIPAIYATTLFAVAIPLKIWNNTRNEKKLEEQERLLVEARLAALTSQINPALPVQYSQLGFIADSHRSQPGARDGGEAFESPAPPVAQT